MIFKIRDINNNLYVGIDDQYIVIQHMYICRQHSNFDNSEFRKAHELSYSDIAPDGYYNLVTFR